jgi:flagellar export protein FliJ
MQKFKFNLVTVLKVRQQIADRLRQEYWLLRRQIVESYRRLNQLLSEMQNAEAGSRGEAGRPLDLIMKKAYLDYLHIVTDRCRETRDRIRALETQAKHQHHLLMEARKGVRVLEQLQERRRLDYRKAGRRQEQKVFDEIALARHRSFSAPMNRA